MTSGHFFVSGYNVISAWPELRELGNLGTRAFAKSLDKRARSTICHCEARFLRRSNPQITRRLLRCARNDSRPRTLQKPCLLENSGVHKIDFVV